jgi:hypothetical protein
LPIRLYSAAWYSPRFSAAQKSRYAALSRSDGDFAERVAERLQKIVVGADDGAVEVELDDSLRAADGGGKRLICRGIPEKLEHGEPH